MAQARPWSLEDAATFLPAYLSPGAREELFSELKKLRDNMAYYTRLNEGNALQGDGWKDVAWMDFSNGRWRQARGFLVSNTCDIAAENERSLPPRITFAALVRMDKFIGLLRAEGVDESIIKDKVAAIRRQEATSVFHLPDGPGTDGEYLAFLDDVQAHPIHRFTENAEKHRIFSLSQAGFWVLLIKLAIHFCRANENVNRGHVHA